MYVFMYVGIPVCLCAVCMYVRMHISVYLYACKYVRTYVCMYVRTYVCMYVRMYICRCVCICMYTGIYVYN